MAVTFINIVVLADNVSRLAAWYRKVMALKAKSASADMVELRAPGLRILICHRATFSSDPAAARRSLANTVLVQLRAADVTRFLRRVKQHGGRILFGPSVDTENGKPYQYGGFTDPEGNPFWVAER